VEKRKSNSVIVLKEYDKAVATTAAVIACFYSTVGTPLFGRVVENVKIAGRHFKTGAMGQQLLSSSGKTVT
jgi:hypothetical protein